ncbi:MAG: hypothetical protein WCF64_03585, partial [Methylocella sp.]
MSEFFVLCSLFVLKCIMGNTTAIEWTDATWNPVTGWVKARKRIGPKISLTLGISGLPATF